MKSKGIDNAKVGLFVLAGLAFLVVMLYMIGRNRNLLGSNFSAVAVVSNVDGLVPGNNVRFMGIDVGTVKSIDIANDTAVYITMAIDDDIKPYIKSNAIATIGTDGLMGNKLISLTSRPGSSEQIEEGEIILTLEPVETDEMLRTLNTTNQNIEKISRNLYEMTSRLNRDNSFWTLLSDTVIANDLKKVIRSIERTASNTAEITESGKALAKMLQKGDGLVATLFTDSVLVQRLSNSMREIEESSTQTSFILEDIKKLTANVHRGEGVAGLIVADTTFRESLLNSAIHLEQGTERFNENMEALKSNFLFRRYFKKLEKQKQQELKDKTIR